MNTYNTILEGLESGDLEFKFFDEVYYKQDNKWKRRRKTYAEQVAEYTAEANAIATATAQVKVDEANQALSDAEAMIDSFGATNAIYVYGTGTMVGTTLTLTDANIKASTYITVTPLSETAGTWSVESADGSFTLTSDAEETSVEFEWNGVGN